MRNRSVLLAATAALASIFAAPSAASAVELLVADSNATADTSGALIRVGPTGAQSIVSSNQLSTAAGGPGLFGQPYDVGVAPDGSILVVDNQGAGALPRLLRVDGASGRQAVVSSDAVSAAAGGEQDFNSPTSVTVAGGQYYMTDGKQPVLGQPVKGVIVRVNPANGSQALFTSDAISLGQGGLEGLASTWDLVPLPAGGFAVTTTDAYSIKPKGVVGVSSTGKQSLISDNAKSLAADGEAPFSSPTGITLGPGGTLYVADAGSARVIKVEPSGKATTLASAPSIGAPGHIEYGPDGRLYVADFNRNAIFSLSPAGGPVTVVSSNATSAAAGGAQAFSNPIGLTVAPSGGGGGGGAAKPQCSDGRDNDGDSAVDQADPGCLSGPNDSYNPADNDESDEGVRQLVLCGRRKISLVRADVRGRRVVLSGLVASSYGARKVSLSVSYGGKRRKLKSVRPAADGQFSATVPRPQRRLRTRARYDAGVAGARSKALKLPQSLASTSIRRRGALIELRGTVKRSLLGKRNPVVVRRILCGRYTKVGSARPSRNGRYVVRFRAPSNANAALYRADTRVLARPRGRRYVRQYARALAIRLTGQSG